MPLRSFTARDGSKWRVWLVVPSHALQLVGAPAEWLSFQSQDGTELFRQTEVPPDWQTLSDEALDGLRRNGSEACPGRRSPPAGQTRIGDDRSIDVVIDE